LQECNFQLKISIKLTI